MTYVFERVQYEEIEADREEQAREELAQRVGVTHGEYVLLDVFDSEIPDDDLPF